MPSASRVPVIYKPGQPIDTRRPLQVENLPSELWGPIADAYPEVAAAGPNASFHGKRNTTVFPPTNVGVKSLSRILTFSNADRTIYRWDYNGRLAGVLIHVHGRGGGYDSVHIYHLASSEMRRAPRRGWRP